MRISLPKVQFITLEEDDEDLIVSFALEDEYGDFMSLILLRTLFYESVLDEDERGVHVSLEGDEFDEEDRNVLVEVKVENDKIVIRSTFREYALDISGIEEEEIEEMVRLMTKQNYDNRFTLHVA